MRFGTQNNIQRILVLGREPVIRNWKHWPAHHRACRQHCRAAREHSDCPAILAMLQVAVRLRPLNAREVAQGDTEAVTISPEDQHALQVRHLTRKAASIFPSSSPADASTCSRNNFRASSMLAALMSRRRQRGLLHDQILHFAEHAHHAMQYCTRTSELSVIGMAS